MNRFQHWAAAAGLLIGLAGAGWAWRERAALERAETALAAAQARLATAHADLRGAESRLAQAQADAANAAATRPGLPDSPEAPPRMGPRNPPIDFAADPEIAPLMLKQRQRQLATRYAALYARLGLSPETRAKLEALLADKQLSRFEAMGLSRRQGLNREEALALARQSDGEADTAIRTLLGEGAFTQLEQYDQTYAQRVAVNTLAGQLSYAGAALSLEQQEQLIAVLAEHAIIDPPAASPGASGGFGPFGRLPFGRDATEAEIQTFFANKAASDAEALQQASRFLAPAQVAAVREAQAAETDQLRLTALRVQRLRAAGR